MTSMNPIPNLYRKTVLTLCILLWPGILLAAGSPPLFNGSGHMDTDSAASEILSVAVGTNIPEAARTTAPADDAMTGAGPVIDGIARANSHDFLIAGLFLTAFIAAAVTACARTEMERSRRRRHCARMYD